jgi:hypothetical protein
VKLGAAGTDKSFLLLFFKKEVLPAFPRHKAVEKRQN